MTACCERVLTTVDRSLTLSNQRGLGSLVERSEEFEKNRVFAANHYPAKRSSRGSDLQGTEKA